MARISELHYSNAYAASSGISEFIEIALRPNEDPADFTVSFYQANGNVGVEIPLDAAGVQFTTDGENNEKIYVISADFFNIRLTDPDGGGSNNYEAYALVNTATNTVEDFYDIGGGTQNIVANNGLAAGETSENLPVIFGPQATITTLQFNQPNPDTLVYDAAGPGDTGLACFVKGTLIDTPNGAVPIDTLSEGNWVNTVDHGPCQVRWVGQSKVEGVGDFAPIRFKKGVLGAKRNILVSPQHRVLVQGWQSELLFGKSEILVPAVSLVNGTTVARVERSKVTYVHIMFDRHQLVSCSGFVSESFFPGDFGTQSMRNMNAEFRALFPEDVAKVHRISGLVRPVEQGRTNKLLNFK